MNEEQTFQKIVEKLLQIKNVTQVRMFGSPGLRVSNKVFAFLWKKGLVLKLPQPRVQSLVDSRKAELFDPGHGRVSKEWVSVGPELKGQWLRLAEEAKEFVRSRRQVTGRGR